VTAAGTRFSASDVREWAAADSYAAYVVAACTDAQIDAALTTAVDCHACVLDTNLDGPAVAEAVAAETVALLEDIAGPCGYCRFCQQPVGPDYHLVGSAPEWENPACCDDCWDERLR
jgi:hypothetical protein